MTQINKLWIKKITPLAFLAMLLLPFYSTILSLWTKWNTPNESMSHGILIVIISAYLLFNLNPDKPAARKPSLAAAIPLLILSLLWYCAAIVGIDLIQQMVLPAIMFFGLYLLLGRAATPAIIFPCAYLYFAIPIWDYLTPYLVTLTTEVAVRILNIFSITFLVEGNNIYLESGIIVIADGCSGLRYLIVSLAIASLIAYLYANNWRKIVTVLLLGIFLALLANWFRVYSLIHIADYTNMESSLVKTHDTYGWILFGLFISPVYIVTRKWAKQDKPKKYTQASNLFASSALGFLICLAGPLLHWYTEQNSASDAPITIAAPDTLSRINPEDLHWNPAIPKPNMLAAARIPTESSAIELSYYLYKADNNGQFVPYIRRIYSKNYYVLEQHTRKTKLEGKSINITETQLKKKDSELYIFTWYLYNVGGLLADNKTHAKLLQIPAKLSGNPWMVFSSLSIKCDSLVECNYKKRNINSNFHLLVQEPS